MKLVIVVVSPLRNAASALFAVAHYDQAILAGALALRDLLRDTSGLHNLDGEPLVGSALSPKQPRLVLADLSTERGRNEQRGVFLLASGIVFALRNTVAHHAVGFQRAETVEALATMSFVARKIEAGRRVDD